MKIAFPLVQDEDGYPPAAEESLWGKRLNDDIFEIDSIPYFVKGISVGDAVVAEAVGGRLIFRSVKRTGGHSTFRIAIYDESEVQAVRNRLRKMGVESELSHIPNLIALDIPPNVELNSVRSLLDEGMAEGRWDYEEAARVEE